MPQPSLPDASVAGYVINLVSHATIPEAKVTLSRVPGLQELTTETDGSGYYEFILGFNWPDSTTYLTASCSGYGMNYRCAAGKDVHRAAEHERRR